MTSDTFTPTAPLAAGQLVCWNVTTDHHRTLSVIQREALDRLCVDTKLTDTGWRLAVADATGWQCLVRRTGRSRWLACWGQTVDIIELREVTTEVVTVNDAPVIVAGLGPKIRNAFANQCQASTV